MKRGIPRNFLAVSCLAGQERIPFGLDKAFLLITRFQGVSEIHLAAIYGVFAEGVLQG